MAAPLMVGFTPNIIVEGAYTVRVTALDATTGNVVSGVNILDAAILAHDVGDQSSTQTVTLVPGLLP